MTNNLLPTTVIPPKRQSMSLMLSYIVFALMLVAISVTCYMMFVMDPKVQSINRVRQQASQAETQLWRVAYSLNRVSLIKDSNEREKFIDELTQYMRAFSNSINNLDDTLPQDLPEVKDGVRRASNNWSQVSRDVEPALRTNDLDEITKLLLRTEVENRVRLIISSLSSAAGDLSRHTEATSERSSMISTSVYLIVLVMIFWVLILSRNVTGRINTLHLAAQRIAHGDLAARAPVSGNDEITELAESFNNMAHTSQTTIEAERKARKRSDELITAIRQASDTLAQSASDILAATTEQAAAMSQEAAAVQETSVTVEELKQVTALAAQKAGTVASLALQSEEVTLCGREAVDRSVEGMLKVRAEVQSLSQSMQRLSEQTQAVGEIISTVQDIAEQSNMLAVNAAIEAARAGEHGYGFSVVANEVRSLAEQSRQATVQVRSILGEIQKAVTTALANTHSGSQSAEAGLELVNKAGEVIRSLTETISHSSSAASQIRASSDQHAAGVDQIALAISSIRDASVQALENTHQTERQAKTLKEMSFTLKSLLSNDHASKEVNK